MIQARRGLGEKKTKQISMVVKPSVYEAFRKVAYIQGITPNSLVGDFMERYSQEHQELIQQYDKERTNERGS